MRTKGKKAHSGARKRSRTPAGARKLPVHAPIWQEILRIAREIPEGDLHKLPTDLAAHHDHYLYGSRRG